jgi:hypothetical protein
MNLNDRLQLILLVAVTGHKLLIWHHCMYHSNTRIADQFALLYTNQLQPAELRIHTAHFIVCYIQINCNLQNYVYIQHISLYVLLC